jgi:hypothetical protein
MTLLISKDSGMTAMIRCAGVGDHRDGGKRGMVDHTCVRVSQGDEWGVEDEGQDDLDRRGISKDKGNEPDLQSTCCHFEHQSGTESYYTGTVRTLHRLSAWLGTDLSADPDCELSVSSVLEQDKL